VRTLIQGGWVVGFDGRSHRLFRDGTLVYEDDHILNVGRHAFEGQVERRIDPRGMLVMPGLINCHLHLGTNAPHAYFLDETKADYFGANFYAYSVARRGAADARAANRPDVEQLYGLWSEKTSSCWPIRVHRWRTRRTNTPGWESCSSRSSGGIGIGLASTSWRR
jgi:hypothetical protein